ncbi:MAG: D-alanyl-D-alanine carboxypeptidase family protein [Ruminococcus sp.]|nr:D-alanyl-D-alanine carboxypeptidase family protein [Ruminococcus sp.]
MGKISTFINGLLCVALVGGICYEGFSIYSSFSRIPNSNVTSISIGESNVNNEISQTEETTTDGSVLFRNIQVENKVDLYSGNLVNVTIDNYSDYYSKNLELSNIYENRNEYYAVNSIDDEISSNVIGELNSMLSDFGQATDNTDSMIKLAYIYPDDLTDILKCDHITGLSFNLSSYDGNTIEDFNGSGDFSWIMDRADKYGFIQRYPSDKVQYTGIDEPSHFRYVGLPHSSYMKENNLCLEEYIATVKLYTYDNPLEITTFNGRTYDVYYVSAYFDDSYTNIPIPMDKEYSISGDNVEGYIVTVKVSG